MRVYYFGCVHGSGHHLHAPGPRTVHREEVVPTFFGGTRGANLDTDFCPGVTPELRRRGSASLEQPEGVARVTHVEGWTVLSFWDRSVDNRRGSHSTFAMEGTRDFAAAVVLAREAFPSVWARYKFEVRQ